MDIIFRNLKLPEVKLKPMDDKQYIVDGNFLYFLVISALKKKDYVAQQIYVNTLDNIREYKEGDTECLNQNTKK